MKRRRNRKAEKNNINLILPLLLGIVMLGSTFAASYRVNQVVSDACFEILTDTAQQGAAEIKVMLEAEQKQMQNIADMLADHKTLNEETCRQYLTSLSDGELVSSYSVLLPDNRMVYGENDSVRMIELPDYEVEKEKLSYLKDVFETVGGQQYAAYVYPIQEAGLICGILYGYINLADFPEKLTMYAFDGKCQMYLANGDTGNFLMDTWHDSLGNMYDSNLLNREVKKGISFGDMKKQVAQGESGYLVYESKTTGEDFYTCFVPVGMHNLSFQLTVPDTVVFADAVRIGNIISLLCIAQFACCFICFVLLLRKSYAHNKEQQRKLERSHAMYEIQKILFDAYKKPELITEGLKCTAEVIEAEEIALVVFHEGIAKAIYHWPPARTDMESELLGKSLKEHMPALYEKILRGESLLLSHGEVETWKSVIEKLFSSVSKIHTLISVPVLASDGQILGGLIAGNIEHMEESREALEIVASDFLMSIQNMDSYRLIHQMGIKDTLTGLKNRNAYQKDLAILESSCGETLACIYMDANGLRELNNTFGHAAGDAMLKYVGGSLKKVFGEERAYRIGGDEFVVFCVDMEKKSIREKVEQLNFLLNDKGYHASVGYFFGGEGQSIQQMIAEAEKKMYEEKREYYSQEGKDRRKR